MRASTRDRYHNRESFNYGRATGATNGPNRKLMGNAYSTGVFLRPNEIGETLGENSQRSVMLASGLNMAQNPLKDSD